ncbi:MAG: glycosyltransferase family 4 protein [Thaumarchaeota archaeon]|nr:glycosyltransferase family 4 protein [Nitrososphaerota archaeon]
MAQVTPYFAPVEGGVERHVLELSLQLRKKGHSVDVYTSNETRTSERLRAYSEVRGIPVYRFRSLLSLGEFGKFWPGFVPEILERDYDVIHAHGYRHPHTDIAAAVSKLKNVRSVMTAHSPFHPSGVRGPLAEALVPIYDRFVAPVTLRAFDKVVSLTPAEAKRLILLGVPKDRVVEISHGVGPENFIRIYSSRFLSSVGLDPEDDLVLYLGRINRTKGIDVLIDAFAQVSSKAPSARLVVAGPATSSEEVAYLSVLRARAGALGIANKVIFTGRLSEEEKLEAYEACRFLVLPSLYEPFGIVLLEAAAHAKPVVSTLTDGPKTIVKDASTGILVRVGDVGGLARAMERLLEDDGLVETMSANALEMARQHSWEMVATQVEQAYLSVQN